MEQIYIKALANYSPEKMSRFLETRDIGGVQKYKQNFTILHTGPTHVNTVLSSCNSMEDCRTFGEKPEENTSYYDELPQEFIDTSKGNTTNWLNTKAEKNKDEDLILSKIISSIEFEINHLRVLELETYVAGAVDALSFDSEIKKSRFIEKLLTALSETKFIKNVKYISFTNLENMFFTFYVKNFAEILLEPKQIKRAIEIFSFPDCEDAAKKCLNYLEFILGHFQGQKIDANICKEVEGGLHWLGKYIKEHNFPDEEFNKLSGRFEKQKQSISTRISFFSSEPDIKPLDQKPLSIQTTIQEVNTQESEKNPTKIAKYK